MKHTPAPWKITDGGKAADNTQFISTYGGLYICETDGGPQSKANARLIAAAPELLAALKAVLNSTDCNLDEQSDETSEAMKQAYAVIAKARGNP